MHLTLDGAGHIVTAEAKDQSVLAYLASLGKLNHHHVWAAKKYEDWQRVCEARSRPVAASAKSFARATTTRSKSPITISETISCMTQSTVRRPSCTLRDFIRLRSGTNRRR